MDVGWAARFWVGTGVAGESPGGWAGEGVNRSACSSGSNGSKGVWGYKPEHETKTDTN